MGIRSTFTSDFTAIDLTRMADDMLAEVVAEHVQDKFTPSNRANAVIASGYVPYTVSLGGRIVARGQGEILPKVPLVAAMKATGRRAPVVDVYWLWERLQGSALERAVKAYARADATLARIQNAAEFARIVVFGERHELFRYLLIRYLAYRYPRVAEAIATARDLYKWYRRAKLVDNLLLGGGKGDTGDADAEVLSFIAQELRDRSPVLTGAYREAHELYADGQMIANAADVTEDMELPEAGEFSFTNTLPYARKIEIGKTKSGRSFVINAEPNLYERVAADARARFGNSADIRFEMRAVIGGTQTPQRRARKPHNNPDVRFPSIVVRFR